MDKAAPVSESKRHAILDIVRGFALLGICLANFPEFSLYTFLPPDVRATMPSHEVDTISLWWLFAFIDGKFYTIFSLLFGIGFSIILRNSAERGADGYRVFYRRMFWLLVIGFLHLMLLWSGDILMLYALVGMVLPAFTRLRTRTLLILAAFFLFLPVIVDAACQIFSLKPSAWLVDQQWELCDRYGITEDNFPYWLRDAQSYPDVFKFLVQGAVVRMQEFVNGNRYFKVLGLFLIGYCIGRHRLYAELDRHKLALRLIAYGGLAFGLLLSALYARSSVTARPMGKTAHSLLYFTSVYLTSFAYIAVICLMYGKFRKWRIWRILSCPGRMALTCYIGQSALGMMIFYGIGLGLGASMWLCSVELVALCVYAFEAVICSWWLSAFRFGPLEWAWRCLTYRKLFRIVRTR